MKIYNLIKKEVVIRFVIIGMLHAFLYLWLVPFVVYPKFGHNGFMFIVVVAVLISVATLGTLFIGRKKQHDLNRVPDDAVNSNIYAAKHQNDAEQCKKSGEI